MEAVVESRARLNEVQRLAYDLYAASFSESNADARFMMLMMALEALIDDIEKLLAQSGLPRWEVALPLCVAS
ncbi:hypothetical protein [Amycolatopsis methanolica]|uniref:hypothetical protein n=1 Tax=Amycolatopsis methanolica TaxID=1814 RepID=UPI00342CE40B